MEKKEKSAKVLNFPINEDKKKIDEFLDKHGWLQVVITIDRITLEGWAHKFCQNPIDYRRAVNFTKSKIIASPFRIKKNLIILPHTKKGGKNGRNTNPF